MSRHKARQKKKNPENRKINYYVLFESNRGDNSTYDIKPVGCNVTKQNKTLKLNLTKRLLSMNEFNKNKINDYGISHKRKLN